MIQINLNLVFTIINLLILYVLMKKFLFGPIIRVMDQRQQMLDQQFEEAQKTENMANELQKKYEDALKSARRIRKDCRTGKAGSKESGREYCSGSQRTGRSDGSEGQSRDSNGAGECHETDAGRNWKTGNGGCR